VLTEANAFALFVTSGGARVLRLTATPDALSQAVADLRDTIARSVDGAVETAPFNVALARSLYVDLFGPIAGDVAGLSHLIFEPDGALLQLPINLLVAEQAGVDAYAARAPSEDADLYDFRGIAWLGRKQIVTTSVSPKAFIEVRAIAASRASKAYLGLGENERITTANIPARPQDDCAWPLGVWGNPISSDELRFASNVIGAGRSDVVTRDRFSDSAMAARSDLSDYRILHFATHGLVTAPRADCPARPALVTSFAPGNSDGLLSFREIFDLRLDADLVLLSACDTAGAATAEATRDAGVSTGGNFALDGLVRAFVAAGARSVIASHWPVPDDFDATKTLITGLFSAPKGEAVGTSLQRAQIGMMDSAETSHPFYWSAFSIIGDASKAVIAPE
jgi:CHAT domain-containing protein